MSPTRPVSTTELEVLKALWDRGPSTVRDLAEGLRSDGKQRAYTTVQTLLKRLEEKGYVQTDTSGYAHVFRAAISRDSLVRQRLTDLADQLCEGAATPLVRALVSNHQFSPQEIRQFRAMLDEKEDRQS